MSDTKAKKTNRRFKFKLPHVYTIMFLLIVVFAVLTWIVPSGQYQRKTISTAAGEREVAVAGTYEQVDKNYTDSETGETINLGQDIGLILPDSLSFNDASFKDDGQAIQISITLGKKHG